jgi:CRP-like cAMP-binding protein
MDKVRSQAKVIPINFILKNSFASYRNFIVENSPKAVTIPAGTCLTRAGQPIENMFFLLTGTVKVYTINISGYIRLLGYHKDNTIFAMDGLRIGQPATVTTESVTDIEVIKLSFLDIRRLCMKNMDFCSDLLIYYGDVLRLMCFDAESQSINDVTTRFANFLYLFMQSDDYQQKGYVRMSQQNLASAIRSSRVQVARVCAKLKQEGIIEVGKGKLRIIDEKRIRQYSQFSS